MELLLRLGLHELVLQLIMIELRRILELDGRHRARVVACRRRLLLRRHLLWRRDWRVQRGTRRQLCLILLCLKLRRLLLRLLLRLCSNELLEPSIHAR